MQIFLEHRKTIEGPVALIGKDLTQYFNPGFNRQAEEYGVCLISIKPNTAFLYHPFQVSVLSPLKKLFRSIVAEWR